MELRPGIVTSVLPTATAGGAGAAAIELSPDDATSEDVFFCAFAVSGVFGIPPPRSTDLDIGTLNRADPDPRDPVPVANFLPPSDTGPFILDGVLRAHDAGSLTQFDPGGVTPDSAIRSAAFPPKALPALGAFQSPTADSPIVIDLRAVTGAWDVSTPARDNPPDVSDTIAAPFVQTIPTGAVEFEITAPVKGWLVDPDRTGSLCRHRILSLSHMVAMIRSVRQGGPTWTMRSTLGSIRSTGPAAAAGRRWWTAAPQAWRETVCSTCRASCGTRL